MKNLLPILFITSTLLSADPQKPITFTVCDKPLATEPLPTKPAAEILSKPLTDTLEAHSLAPDQNWLSTPQQHHPFLHAAHIAFKDHRPLAISPDMIWLLLTQMAAEEVIKQPEAYRQFFANHEFGKRTLSVRRDEFIPGSANNDWHSVFREFEAKIIANTSDSPAAKFSHPFSTSTPSQIATRRLTLLAAASPFYEYRLMTLCGIPRFEIHGTATDWQWIRDNADELRKLGLNRRIDALIPILDEFVNTANNKPDPTFWRSFYKFSSESGSSYVSGWINLFFIQENEKLLDEVLKPDFKWSAAPITATSLGAQNLPLALRTGGERPSGRQQIDFTWELPNKDQLPMLIQTGFLGIAQDPKTLTLTPTIGWQVLKSTTSSEERSALNYLATLQSLDQFRIFSLQNSIIFDKETQKITFKPNSRTDTVDHNFWIKALPKMSNLQHLEISELLNRTNELEHKKAICTAALAAPSLKHISAQNGYLPPECLKILQDRKDWTIETD